MNEPYLRDFLGDVASELYMLDKVAPLLVVHTAHPSSYSLKEDRMDITVGVQDVTIGMTLGDAIEQLGMRPLAFASAWKVLDILFEYSLVQDGKQPRRGGRWTIAEKVAHAKRGAGQAAPLTNNSALWLALMNSYAATEEIRHSLVHRRADIGPSGEIVGTSTSGASLPPLTSREQTYFMRSVQRAVQYFKQPILSSRDEAALWGELDQITDLTGTRSRGGRVVNHPAIPIKVPVVLGQEIDFLKLKSRVRASSPTVAEFDVYFEVGTNVYCAHLEDLPDETTKFTVKAPWLT